MKRLEIKAGFSVDETGQITGLAWPFGSPDLEGDVITPGAFKGAVGPIPMLFAHDQADAVGVWDTVAETKKGLEVKGRLLINDIARAGEVRALVREGGASGLSVGFVTTKSAPRKGGRTITALDLKEVSIVPVPCHPGATITSIKSTPRMTKLNKAAEDEIEIVADEETETTIEERVTALESDVAEIKTTIGSTAETVDEVDKGIKRLETKLARPGIIRTPAEKPGAVEKKAFATYLRHGTSAPALELKSLRRGNDSKGGYLAPPEFVNELIREIVEHSPIREHAFVGNTGSPSVILPGRVGRTNAKWKGETETQEESTFGFEEQEIAVHEINTFVDVSNQLLEDSTIDVEAEVRMAFAEDLGGKENEAFLFGDGVKKPSGFMVDPRIAEYASGAAGAILADGLIGMLYSVPQVYRNDGTWIMNGDTLGKLRVLKDGQQNYIWQPGLAAGQPETILGRPVVEVLDMPDVAAGAFPIAYGNLNQAYRIYDRVDVEILVNPFLLATEGKTRIHMRKRLGGGVVRPLAIKKLKVAAS